MSTTSSDPVALSSVATGGVLKVFGVTVMAIVPVPTVTVPSET